jgi:hypothetical protein
VREYKGSKVKAGRLTEPKTLVFRFRTFALLHLRTRLPLAFRVNFFHKSRPSMASTKSGLRVWFCLWSRLLAFVAVVLSSVVLGASQANGADSWHVLETSRFTIVSQWNEKDTRAWADDFNQYIEALRKIIKVNEALLPHLTVVFFARDKAFRPYLPTRPDGKPWPVAGYFSRRNTWAVIGLAEGYNDESTRQTIFHEGVHWLLSAFIGFRTPLWLNEGLAEVFSTFNVTKHKANWGDPLPYHVYLLQQQSPMPLDKLLAVGHSNRLFNEDDRVSIFYAQSWAFVHYLLFGVHKGSKNTLSDFLEATGAGLTPDAAFRKCFSVDTAGMDGLLRKYLRGGSYYEGRAELNETTKVTTPFSPVAPEFVEAALAKLALAGGHEDLARKHAQAAVAIAPKSPLGYDILAAIAEETKDSTGALAASQKAADLGTKDAWSLFVLAYEKDSAAAEHAYLPPAEARAIANLYEKSINLQRNLRPAFLNLAGILGSVERISESDDKFLLFGRQQFPDEAALLIGLAELARKRGKIDDAQQMIADALTHQDVLSIHQINELKQVQQQWLYTDTLASVEALAQKQKFHEALALLDKLEAQDLSLDRRIPLRGYRQNLRIYAKLEDARQAGLDNHREEARRLYGEALQIPSLPPRLRQQAETALRRLGGPGDRSIHSSNTSADLPPESVSTR